MQRQRVQDEIDIMNSGMFDETTIPNLVLPGDLITSQNGFMNGHGTYESEGSIYSSLLGSIQKTNKLIIVNSLRNKYNPQIGDVIVGRVVEIVNKRWRVDIGSSTHAFLHLNSTYIPTQRKKNEQDELNMRRLIAENDLIVAEIHSLNNDKTVSLHTRNVKYGKLEVGALVNVEAKLVRKQKHHLLQVGPVSMILSNNGNIFLSNRRRNESVENTANLASINLEYSQKQLEEISLLSSLIKVLNHERLDISEEFINELRQYCLLNKIKVEEILYKGGLKSFLRKHMETNLPKRMKELTKHISFQ